MKRLIPLFFLAISFAYIESAVVVYLRELYYPEGFKFPLRLIPTKVGLIEVGRETATLIMIATIGLVSGKTRWQRISYSIFVFGIWDIFYYVWLKVFLNWPESLVTWDILFLIPVPWIAPVLAPLIVATTISAASMIIVYLEDNGIYPAVNKTELLLMITGASIIFVSFIWDYQRVRNGWIPDNYHWELLLIGELIVILSFIKTIKNVKSFSAFSDSCRTD